MSLILATFSKLKSLSVRTIKNMTIENKSDKIFNQKLFVILDIIILKNDEFSCEFIDIIFYLPCYFFLKYPVLFDFQLEDPVESHQ